MAVTDTTSRWEYDGDGVSTTFPYENIIFAAADMRVLVDGVIKVLETDYTVTNIGAYTGGNVVFITPPPAGDKNVILQRNVPITQESQYPPGDKFPSGVVERCFDKLTVICQQLMTQISRSLRLPDSVAGDVSVELPVPEANRLIGWNNAGTGLQNRDVVSGEIALPISLQDGGLGASHNTTAEARDTLGLGSAAVANIGTLAGNVIAWFTGPKYPAGDGSLITNVPMQRKPARERQTVLQGSVDANGMANFLSAGAGTNIAVAATTVPIIVTAANGVDINGEIDRVGAISADTTIAGIPAVAVASASFSTTTITVNTAAPHNLRTGALVNVTGFTPAGFNSGGLVPITVVDADTFTYTVGAAPSGVATVLGAYAVRNYVFADVNADQSVTLACDLLPWIAQPAGDFSNVQGQFVFNWLQMIGRLGSGAANAQAYRVAIGQALVATAAVSDVTTYALKGLYHGALQTAPAAGTDFAVNHNLGVTPRYWLLEAECITAADGFQPGVILGPVFMSSGSANYPAAQQLDRLIVSNAGATGFSLRIRSSAAALVNLASNASYGVRFVINRGW